MPTVKMSIGIRLHGNSKLYLNNLGKIEYADTKKNLTMHHKMIPFLSVSLQNFDDL